MFTIGDQLRAIDSLQRSWQEDVARCSGEFDFARFAPQDRQRLIDLALRERGDHDPLRLQLADGFTGDLQADHSAAAEDEDGLRYTLSSSPFGRSQRSVMRSCVSQRSQSRAAWQPVPAAVTACR